jgi:hypothetical protein
MTQRPDDLARNLGKLFDKPAARLELVRHAPPSARDRVLAEVLDLDYGDAHSLTNRMHERRPRDMTHENVEAGLKAFPPLVHAVERDAAAPMKAVWARAPAAVTGTAKTPPSGVRCSSAIAGSVNASPSR